MPSDELDTDLARSLREVGVAAARRVEVICPPGPSKLGRSAFRVELVDGQTVKVRRFESAEAVTQLVELLELLDGTYARVIAWAGATLVEEWVDGTPLDQTVVSDRELAASAAVLGNLHRIRRSSEDALPTGPFRDAAVAHLAACADAVVLRSEEADRLGAVLAGSDPGRTCEALTHWDFCAENIVVDDSGGLRVIDNEWVAVGAPGFDLGRTRARWAMTPSAWSVFLEAYRDVCPIDDGAHRFWTIAAAAWTAQLRLTQGSPELAQTIDLLRSVEG